MNAPTPTHLTREQAEALVAAAPDDLWGLATRGHFYSEHAVEEARSWVRRVVEEAEGGPYAVARTLGWNDAWRQRLDRMSRPGYPFAPATLVALYADLALFAGRPLEAEWGSQFMVGSKPQAQAARLRWVFWRAFEGAHRETSERAGIAKSTLASAIQYPFQPEGVGDVVLAGMRRLGVRAEWIRHGTGPVFADDAPPPVVPGGIERIAHRREFSEDARMDAYMKGTIERLEGERPGATLAGEPPSGGDGTAPGRSRPRRRGKGGPPSSSGPSPDREG